MHHAHAMQTKIRMQSLKCCLLLPAMHACTYVWDVLITRCIIYTPHLLSEVQHRFSHHIVSFAVGMGLLSAIASSQLVHMHATFTLAHVNR